MVFHTLRVALVVAVALLAGCGGGSGGSGGSSSGGGGSSVQTFGTFALALTGGGAPGIKHAWVQVEKVALNEDADRPWDPQDSSWSVITLTTPVAVDLAATGSQFVVGSDEAGSSVAAKTYKQVRLFFVAHDASATLPTVKPQEGGTTQLTYHAQVEYDGSQVVPIEWPSYQSGVKLDQGVVISSGKRSALYARFDAERSLVRFDGDAAQDSIMVRPRTYTYLNAFTDVSSSDGGKASLIVGLIDPSKVCDVGGSTSGCVSDLMVSLHAASGDEQRMENWGSVRVTPVSRNSVRDAYFLLGPVSYSLSAEGTGAFINPQQYDILIRGRGMKTMLIKNVKLDNLITSIGCTGGDNVASQISPVLDSSPRSFAMASPSLTPRAGRVGLGFKIGDGVPYEAFSANTDPFTGLFTSSVALSIPSAAASETILVATMDALTASCPSDVSNTTISLTNRFTEVGVADGLTQSIAYGIGTFYTDAALSSPFGLTGSDFTVPSPTSVAGLINGQVAVTVSGLNGVLAGFAQPKAQLIASDIGGVVSTVDLVPDCGSSSTCSMNMTLPSGTQANARATGVYEFAIRYWDANDPRPAYPSASNGTMKWARAAAFANLRSATSASVTISVP